MTNHLIEVPSLTCLHSSEDDILNAEVAELLLSV